MIGETVDAISYLTVEIQRPVEIEATEREYE